VPSPRWCSRGSAVQDREVSTVNEVTASGPGRRHGMAESEGCGLDVASARIRRPRPTDGLSIHKLSDEPTTLLLRRLIAQ